MSLKKSKAGLFIGLALAALSNHNTYSSIKKRVHKGQSAIDGSKPTNRRKKVKAARKANLKNRK